MATVGTMQAARLAGVNKSTILRAYQRGRLSYQVDGHGRRKVDVAELERCFGRLGAPTEAAPAPGARTDAPPAPAPTEAVAVLERQVLRLEAEVERLRHELDTERRERREAQERLWQLQERYVRLLPAPATPTEAPTDAPRPRQRPPRSPGSRRPRQNAPAQPVTLTGLLASLLRPS